MTGITMFNKKAGKQKPCGPKRSQTLQGELSCSAQLKLVSRLEGAG